MARLIITVLSFLATSIFTSTISPSLLKKLTFSVRFKKGQFLVHSCSAYTETHVPSWCRHTASQCARCTIAMLMIHSCTSHFTSTTSFLLMSSSDALMESTAGCLKTSNNSCCLPVECSKRVFLVLYYVNFLLNITSARVLTCCFCSFHGNFSALSRVSILVW